MATTPAQVNTQTSITPDPIGIQPEQATIQSGQVTCPHCKAIVDPVDNFCPNCGKPIEKELKSIGVGKQIYIYVVAILAPPFGLVWTFKYLKQKSSQVQIVGMVAGILTVVSLIATIWLMIGAYHQIQQLNTINNSNLQSF